MTREDAILQLKALQQDPDHEIAHDSADWVLCDLLSALGYQDVVAEWNKIIKWYA